MNSTVSMDYYARFMQIYANLPLNFRRDIIVVIGEEALSWNAAKIEVENKTVMSKEILRKLVELKIIN